MSDFYVGKIDLAQIECRKLNTLAGQWDIAEKFRNGVDLYSDLASSFYGFPVDKSKPAERGTGKQLELSCGYGAGGPTIVRTARAGTYGPPVYLTDEQGIAARDLYRGTHPAVVGLWKHAERMLWALRNGETLDWRPPGQEAPCMYVHDHRIFHVNGLWLDFTSLERVRPDGETQDIWRHRVRQGWRKTYGARLIENVIQWLARIVISEAMVRIHQHIGVKMPLTVHDDVFVLIPKQGCHTRTLGYLDPIETLAACAKLMEQTLTWMPMCPISAEWKDSAGNPELLAALAK